jgi:hypothetical protein
VLFMTRHFDEFSKSLADERIPRRESLRRFGAALVGALFAPLALRTASAGPTDACKTFCNQCPRSQRSQCLADCRSCTQAGGHLCGTCGGYGCCAAWQDCCGNYCADLDTDIHNCGACGDACDDPGINGYAVCVSGTCQYFFCSPATDYMWDSSNCGRCGNVCPFGTACAFGFCEGGGGDGG